MKTDLLKSIFARLRDNVVRAFYAVSLDPDCERYFDERNLSIEFNTLLLQSYRCNNRQLVNLATWLSSYINVPCVRCAIDIYVPIEDFCFTLKLLKDEC